MNEVNDRFKSISVSDTIKFVQVQAIVRQTIPMQFAAFLARDQEFNRVTTPNR